MRYVNGLDLSAFSEDFAQVICMVKLFLGLYNDVIYIILKAIMEHIMKIDSYDALVGDTSIL